MPRRGRNFSISIFLAALGLLSLSLAGVSSAASTSSTIPQNVYLPSVCSALLEGMTKVRPDITQYAKDLEPVLASLKRVSNLSETQLKTVDPIGPAAFSVDSIPSRSAAAEAYFRLDQLLSDIGVIKPDQISWATVVRGEQAVRARLEERTATLVKLHAEIKPLVDQKVQTFAARLYSA